MTGLIRGSTAAEIASSVRAGLDAGALAPGDALPTARALAQRLGVNRNTVVSAYRQLALGGVVVSRRGAGTTVASPFTAVEEGFRPDTAVTDIGSGNPARRFIPDAGHLALPEAPSVLYGESTIDAGLGAWAEQWFSAAVPSPFDVTVMSGAVDAIERLLGQTLTIGDAVALEDPCFLTSINTVRRHGYRPLPVAMDEEGMLPEALRATLEAGARVLVCTPRAHNPTGISLAAGRADALRAVLGDYPGVLVIEDDHFSMLACTDYHRIVPSGHGKWVLIRSLSKFLGPDLRIALVAADPGTSRQLATQISAGSNWVSHLLQRTALALLTDPDLGPRNESARAHYRDRNALLIGLLDREGFTASAPDGLNVWVDVGVDARAASAELVRVGWSARTGEEFAIAPLTGARHLRLTVHELDDGQLAHLSRALVRARDAVLAQRRV